MFLFDSSFYGQLMFIYTLTLNITELQLKVDSETTMNINARDWDSNSAPIRSANFIIIMFKIFIVMIIKIISDFHFHDFFLYTFNATNAIKPYV